MIGEEQEHDLVSLVKNMGFKGEIQIKAEVTLPEKFKTVLLAGPSGSGKSHLAYILGSGIPPQAGEQHGTLRPIVYITNETNQSTNETKQSRLIIDSVGTCGREVEYKNPIVINRTTDIAEVTEVDIDFPHAKLNSDQVSQVLLLLMDRLKLKELNSVFYLWGRFHDLPERASLPTGTFNFIDSLNANIWNVTAVIARRPFAILTAEVPGIRKQLNQMMEQKNENNSQEIPIVSMSLVTETNQSDLRNEIGKIDVPFIRVNFDNHLDQQIGMLNNIDTDVIANGIKLSSSISEIMNEVTAKKLFLNYLDTCTKPVYPLQSAKKCINCGIEKDERLYKSLYVACHPPSDFTSTHADEILTSKHGCSSVSTLLHHQLAHREKKTIGHLKKPSVIHTGSLKNSHRNGCKRCDGEYDTNFGEGVLRWATLGIRETQVWCKKCDHKKDLKDVQKSVTEFLTCRENTCKTDSCIKRYTCCMRVEGSPGCTEKSECNQKYCPLGLDIHNDIEKQRIIDRSKEFFKSDWQSTENLKLSPCSEIWKCCESFVKLGESPPPSCFCLHCNQSSNEPGCHETARRKGKEESYCLLKCSAQKCKDEKLSEHCLKEYKCSKCEELRCIDQDCDCVRCREHKQKTCLEVCGICQTTIGKMDSVKSSCKVSSEALIEALGALPSSGHFHTFK